MTEIDDEMFPVEATTAALVGDRVDPGAIHIGVMFKWAPAAKEMFFKSLRVNGIQILPPSGTSDTLSPYPSTAPLPLGFVMPGTAVKLEWAVRALDDINGAAI